MEQAQAGSAHDGDEWLGTKEIRTLVCDRLKCSKSWFFANVRSQLTYEVVFGRAGMWRRDLLATLDHVQRPEPRMMLRDDAPMPRVRAALVRGGATVQNSPE